MALLQKAYLGAVPLFRNLEWVELFTTQVVDRPGSITVTADASAHTKGAWSQLVASTSDDISLLRLLISGVNASATNTATLLDIGTGESGSETVVVPDIAIGTASNVTIVIPLKIPSGTRVAARIQSVVTGGKTAAVVPIFLNAGDYNTAPSNVDVISANTANSQGISFTGASGTWTEAISSTSRAYRAVAFVPSAHDADMVNIINTVMEIGVGAAGNEILFGSTFTVYVNNEQTQTGSINFPIFGRNIPAGSRLAVKHNITANPDRYGFCLIGIP